MKFSLLFISTAHATGGAIAAATPLTTILTNILKFLLSVVGVVGIIGLVIAGGMYFFASGNMRQVEGAKKAVIASIVGIVIALAGLIIIATLGSFV